MDLHPCARETLAVGDIAVVERCSCGAVHITIGAITMRLAAPAIAPLAATINEAARALVLRDALAPRELRIREVAS